MELFVHVILLLGGVFLWTGFLLVAFAFLFSFIVAGVEAVTKTSCSPAFTPWVRKFKHAMVVVWIMVALVTSAYYGMQVDVQLNPLVWQKGFYTEVINNE